MYGNPLPWKTTELTPNLGKIDSTDDMRPGLGWQGLANLQKFVREGGVLITVDDTSNFAIQFGFTPGVSVTAAQRLKITGAVLRSKVVDGASPIAYGYDDDLAMYSSDGPIFGVSSTLGGRGGRGGAAERAGLPAAARQTSPTSHRVGRRPIRCRRIRRSKPGRRRRFARSSCATVSASSRPRSGLAWCCATAMPAICWCLASSTAAPRSPSGRWSSMSRSTRGTSSSSRTTRSGAGRRTGSYFLVLNAILNYDNLNAGRKLDAR